jgi:uncharacterized protein YbjT (DUF2867 family)
MRLFLHNLAADPSWLSSGELTTSMSADRPWPWVDPRDIGEIVAARLLSSSSSGRRVQAVHGPEDLMFAQVAEIVSGVTGRVITLQVVSDEDVRQNLRAARLPERAVEGMVGMTSGLRENFTAEQPRSLVTTTPTTLAAWAYVHLLPLLDC